MVPISELQRLINEYIPHEAGSPFGWIEPEHSLRAICTVLLDPRDPLLHSERVQGFAADPDYGRAKCLPMLGSLKT